MAAIFFGHAVASLSMLGLAVVQERFITDPRVTVAFPLVLCDLAPTSLLAVPQPAVTIWLRVHVAWPVA